MNEPNEPPESFFREAYEHVSKGDLSVLQSRFHEDVEWHLPGQSPLAGIFIGFDEVTAFLQRLIDRTDGTMRWLVHDVMSTPVDAQLRGQVLKNGTHSVVLGRIEARRGEKFLSSSDVFVYHIKDGKLGLICWFPEDQYGADEFWA